MKTMKMGILGSGGIAHTMANTVKRNERCRTLCGGIPNFGKCREFAAGFEFQKAYGSYEELAMTRKLIWSM